MGKKKKRRRAVNLEVEGKVSAIIEVFKIGNMKIV